MFCFCTNRKRIDVNLWRLCTFCPKFIIHVFICSRDEILLCKANRIERGDGGRLIKLNLFRKWQSERVRRWCEFIIYFFFKRNRRAGESNGCSVLDWERITINQPLNRKSNYSNRIGCKQKRSGWLLGKWIYWKWTLVIRERESSFKAIHKEVLITLLLIFFSFPGSTVFTILTINKLINSVIIESCVHRVV